MPEVEGADLVLKAILQGCGQNLAPHTRNERRNAGHRTGCRASLGLDQQLKRVAPRHERFNIGGELLPRFKFIELLLTLNAFGGLIRRRFQVVDLFREDSGFCHQIVDHNAV